MSILMCPFDVALQFFLLFSLTILSSYLLVKLRIAWNIFLSFSAGFSHS